MASAEMLLHGISPSRPEDDHGYDIISVHGKTINRVQVKTVYVKTPTKYAKSEKFSIRRTKSSQSKSREALYAPGEIDAFVFVSIVTRSFWVVPVEAVNLRGFNISHRQGSKWQNAWHVLMSEDCDAN
jgi:hypothetical protein